MTKNEKPLGGKAYGSIPHLPGSRRGPADKGLTDHQAAILTSKARDKNDRIIVQEKLDGSCCSVAKKDGKILALTRAGYLATTSPYEQHWMFARWVDINSNRFGELLQEGERCVGEWLAQAHGTRYRLIHEPFVVFDVFSNGKRVPFNTLIARCVGRFITPSVLHDGQPISIDAVLNILEPSRHGAMDKVEGAVWRVERNGEVDFLGKYVRPEKVDGCYLPEKKGGEPIWNWKL